jgi:hypothetical protein
MVNPYNFKVEYIICINYVEFIKNISINVSFVLYYFALIILSEQIINVTTRFLKDLIRKLIKLIMSFL